MNSNDKRKYAEEILHNPLFCDIMQLIKDEAIGCMMNVKWDAEGDAIRRRETLRIQLVDEVISKFSFMVKLDQSKMSKTTKQ